MEQQRALNALAPYLALSKSATSPRAAADLISQATSAPQTYVFAELLETPNIQALRNSQDHVGHLRLLEIFAWGTIGDYAATQGLPQLNPQQHQKLLLLSLLLLCASPATLTYDALSAALFPASTTSTTDTSSQTSSDARLESLLTTALSLTLLAGTLDPLHRTLRCTSTAPLRDIPPNSLPILSATLQDWENRCSTALEEISVQIASIRKQRREDRIWHARTDAAFEDALAAAGDGEGQGGGNGKSGNENFGSGFAGSRGGKGGSGGFAGIGGQMNLGRMFGLGGGGGGGGGGNGKGKRDAGDVMDYEGEGAGKGGARGVKRQGRGGGGAFGR